MDAMVTARVPAEVKEQVNALLREGGSSPTELVNAAYDYYLACGELPRIHDEPQPLCVRLTDEQIDEIRARSRHIVRRLPDDFWNRDDAEGEGASLC